MFIPQKAPHLVRNFYVTYTKNITLYNDKNQNLVKKYQYEKLVLLR